MARPKPTSQRAAGDLLARQLSAATMSPGSLLLPAEELAGLDVRNADLAVAQQQVAGASASVLPCSTRMF